MNSFKKKLISGAIWSIIGQFGYVGVVLITNIILARLLSPYVFGQIGIVMFFIVLFNVLVEGGLGGALIRKKNATNQDYTTVFIFNLTVSLLVFVILFCFSGVIATYYKDQTLKNVLIFSGFLLIANAFQLTHIIKLVRDLEFKKKAAYSLISIILASIIGVTMAFYKFGVWSMVVIQILNSVFMSIILWTFEGNFGKIIFSKSSFKELAGFGAYTTVSLMVNTAFENIYQLVLGRYFSINQVGLFYQAKRLMDMPTALVTVTGSGAVYSSISKLQDDKKEFLLVFNKILWFYTIVIGFIATSVYVFSENIILLLYGAKWIGAAYYMRLLCIVSFFLSLNILNELIFKVFNNTKRILHIMIFRNSFQLITIIIGIWMLNLDVLIYGFVLATIVSFVSYFYFSRKLLSSFQRREILNLFKIITISVVIVVVFLSLINLLHLKGIIAFIFAPIIFLVYILCVQSLKIYDIMGELKSLLKKA